MKKPEAPTTGHLPPSDAGHLLQPDDVRVAVQSSYDVLQPVSEADWSRPAGDLEWDCRATLEHLVLALDRYSFYLATPSSEPAPRTPNRYPNLSNDELLTILRLRAGVLATVVSGSASTARGYHVWGRPDPPGYVAMACVEIILHTGDVSRGLGVAYQPPDELCQHALARLFPWAPTAIDPWSTLQYVTGRLDLPGYGRTASDWAWHSSPLAEWDGTIKTQDSYSDKLRG
jgi:uncharacterized protein (TIGR03083 family)